MKKPLLLAASGIAFACSAVAQTATEPNEGTVLVHDSSNALLPYSFKFWGRSGHFYFIEKTEDLTTAWDYFELAIIGNDAAESLDFNSTSDALFLRLRFTNDRSSELFWGNYDSDPSSNYEEALMGMNPFLAEGSLNLLGDEDNDGVLNEFDAAPYRASVGALSITITYPSNGSTVN
jgi:hypothetical protein